MAYQCSANKSLQCSGSGRPFSLFNVHHPKPIKKSIDFSHLWWLFIFTFTKPLGIITELLLLFREN